MEDKYLSTIHLLEKEKESLSNCYLHASILGTEELTKGHSKQLNYKISVYPSGMPTWKESMSEDTGWAHK